MDIVSSLTSVNAVCEPYLFPSWFPAEAEMSEVVIVTLPDAVDGLSSVEEQEKAVLVAAELTPQAG